MTVEETAIQNAVGFLDGADRDLTHRQHQSVRRCADPDTANRWSGNTRRINRWPHKDPRSIASSLRSAKCTAEAASTGLSKTECGGACRSRKQATYQRPWERCTPGSCLSEPHLHSTRGAPLAKEERNRCEIGCSIH